MRHIQFICLLMFTLSFFSCKKDANKYVSENTITYKYTTKDLWLQRGENRIYGLLYTPQKVANQLPLVILSHGFNGTHKNGQYYAQVFAQMGFMCYALDFCGGSNLGKSDGSTTEMSVLTEKADLEAVLAYFLKQNNVDKSRVFLAGDSQGGFVTSITAADHIQDLAGVLLYYPALCIVDDTHNLWDNDYNKIPSTHQRGALKLGAIYYQDAWNIDIYAELAKINVPVFLIHGDADKVVNISYSERAAKTFPNCEFHTLPGAGHGFKGKKQDTSIQLSAKWMEQFIK